MYLAGHVKRDSDTKSTATRTIFPEDVPAMAAKAWLVATVNLGARFTSTAEVEGWDDIFVPEV